MMQRPTNDSTPVVRSWKDLALDDYAWQVATLEKTIAALEGDLAIYRQLARAALDLAAAKAIGEQRLTRRLHGLLQTVRQLRQAHPMERAA